MSHDIPAVLRHGPLTVWVSTFEGCADLESLAAGLSPETSAVWCDSARIHPSTGRWSLLGFNPWLTLTARGNHLELRSSAATREFYAHPLSTLRRLLGTYRIPPAAPPYTRAIGLLGGLSYEMNRWIERLPSVTRPKDRAPDMLWCAMRTTVVVDHLQHRSWLVSVVDPHRPAARARAEARDAIEHLQASLLRAVRCPHPCQSLSELSPSPIVASSVESTSVVSLHATSTQQEFEGMVHRALEHIRAGEIFQANVAQQFTARWDQPAFPLYQRLRAINPSPFAVWLSVGDLAVVSCSPERLVRVHGGCIDTRPIAGTHRRGATADDDAVGSLELLLSEKERAEHIMLVDLERNDLGRVCRPGSVAVSELMTIEAYSHVLHIVSEVTGTLTDSADAVAVIRALFPGGTITGCPKVRCMKLLQELEPVARGLYTGSLGYIGFDGTMDLNIAIRTMVIQDNQLSFHVGAGIVADSDPQREYQETLAKAAALLHALCLSSASSPRPHVTVR